jgi:hypothetical protein
VAVVLRDLLSNTTIIPHERVEACAEISVARGCGFAWLAIITFMVGLSWDLPLAGKVGGVLAMVVCAVLLVKRARVQVRPYKRTEVWLMLSERERPSPEMAQMLISSALGVTYLKYAARAAFIASWLLLGSLVVGLVGVGEP